MPDTTIKLHRTDRQLLTWVANKATDSRGIVWFWTARHNDTNSQASRAQRYTRPQDRSRDVVCTAPAERLVAAGLLAHEKPEGNSPVVVTDAGLAWLAANA